MYKYPLSGITLKYTHTHMRARTHISHGIQLSSPTLVLGFWSLPLLPSLVTPLATRVLPIQINYLCLNPSFRLASGKPEPKHMTVWCDLELREGFPGISVVKNPSANAGGAGDLGLIPGSGRSPGGGNNNPLLSSCLESPMDRGDWRATGCRIAQSWTRLSN